MAKQHTRHKTGHNLRNIVDTIAIDNYGAHVTLTIVGASGVYNQQFATVEGATIAALTKVREIRKTGKVE